MSCFFFFNDTATTEIYTLSLHDALPISVAVDSGRPIQCGTWVSSSGSSTKKAAPKMLPTTEPSPPMMIMNSRDRKSTRLNSSHLVISYAVFCLKQKNKDTTSYHRSYIII